MSKYTEFSERCHEWQHLHSTFSSSLLHHFVLIYVYKYIRISFCTFYSKRQHNVHCLKIAPLAPKKQASLYAVICTSSISVAEVGEPPDVTQAHSIAHTGEDKLNLVAPVPSPGVFILLHWLAWNCSILQQRHRERQRLLQVTGRRVCSWDKAEQLHLAPENTRVLPAESRNGRRRREDHAERTLLSDLVKSLCYRMYAE